MTLRMSLRMILKYDSRGTENRRCFTFQITARCNLHSTQLLREINVVCCVQRTRQSRDTNRNMKKLAYSRYGYRIV